MSSWGLITSQPTTFASMGRCLKTKDHDQTTGELELSLEAKSEIRAERCHTLLEYEGG